MKMSDLLKLIYRFSAIYIKIPACFYDIDKPILKFVWKCKGLRISKVIEKERQSWRVCAATYQDRTPAEMQWVTRARKKHRPTEQCGVQRGFTKSGNWIYDKECTSEQWEKDSVFNRWCQENWTTIQKMVNLGLCVTSHKNQFHTGYRAKCEK